MEALQIVLPGHVVASAMRAKVDIVSYRALKSARYRSVRGFGALDLIIKSEVVELFRG
jgi:hypothetical protein